MLPFIEEEEAMSSNMLKIALWSLILAAATPSGAQSPADAPTFKGTECGGQYECVEDRQLTQAEARASLGYPQVAQPQEPAPQEPAKVAVTQPTTTK
jgi:hypothetical protein